MKELVFLRKRFREMAENCIIVAKFYHSAPDQEQERQAALQSAEAWLEASEIVSAMIEAKSEGKEVI
ncbi:MAG: hypothetical protein E7661_04550 [Ruminococcaceae bacterium]|nr:hypothetical protein [Oscillospiraceae bacterium]